MKKIKGSKRGLTFTLEGLHIGAHYRYVVDKENHQVMIIPDKNGKITVSKKRTGKIIKPLIDIRCREVKELVSAAEYIELELQGKKVVVRTYCRQKSKIRQFKNDKVSIQDLFGTKTAEFVIPEKMLLVSGIDNYPTMLFGQPTLADDAYFDYLCRTAPIHVNKKRIKKDVRKVYDVISLFSGAGMFDKAFMDERFRFVYGVDFEKAAVETYRANIGPHIECKDIRNVRVEDVPDADVCIGGPCCQAYSNCNRHNIDSEKAEQKRLLIEDYARIVKEKKPKVWVVENVPEFLTKSDGMYFNKLLESLSGEYEITSTLVVDCDAGGYSRRKRAIVIGSKIGRIELPKTKCVPYHTVREALTKVNAEWFNFNDVTVPSEKTKEKMSYVPQGGNWKNIPKEIYSYGPNTQSNIMRRLAWNEPAITISNFRKSNILHPDEDRTLTVAEAAAIMGLDKDFKFIGRLSEIQQMVANGVTQAIGKLVRNTILKALDEKNNIAVFA